MGTELITLEEDKEQVVEQNQHLTHKLDQFREELENQARVIVSEKQEIDALKDIITKLKNQNLDKVKQVDNVFDDLDTSLSEAKKRRDFSKQYTPLNSTTAINRAQYYQPKSPVVTADESRKR